MKGYQGRGMYMFAGLLNPLTMAMAAERPTGGPWVIFDTHTRVSAILSRIGTLAQTSGRETT